MNWREYWQFWQLNRMAYVICTWVSDSMPHGDVAASLQLRDSPTAKTKFYLSLHYTVKQQQINRVQVKLLCHTMVKRTDATYLGIKFQWETINTGPWFRGPGTRGPRTRGPGTLGPEDQGAGTQGLEDPRTGDRGPKDLKTQGPGTQRSSTQLL